MMRLLCICVIYVGIITVCRAGVIDVQNCTGIMNRVKDVEVDVSDCPNGNNCTLYKGNIYNLMTTFTANENFSLVNMRVLGVMGILKIPHLSATEVCPEVTTEDGENCNSEVGFVQGQTYTHVKDFPVRRLYPKINMRARVEYFVSHRSTRRSVILCYEIPIQIQDPPDSGEENEIELSHQ